MYTRRNVYIRAKTKPPSHTRKKSTQKGGKGETAIKENNNKIKTTTNHGKEVQAING